MRKNSRKSGSMQSVLNTKIYVKGNARERALKSLHSLVENLVGDLEITYELQLRSDDRVEIRCVGEDSEAAHNLVREEFGEMETDPENGGTYIGSFEEWSSTGIRVDIGRDVHLSREALEDLGVGSPTQLRERYGLVQHLPLEIVWGDEPRLSSDQLDVLWSWRKGPGRVNVNSVTRAEVRATVNRAGHAHDIVGIERLGLLEQSIVCSDETDPPGLVASIGKYIQGEMKCVVN